MSFKYTLRFASEDESKTVLKPLGFAVDSRYGVVFLNITQKYILSNKYVPTEGYYVIIESQEELPSIQNLIEYIVNE